MSEAMDRAAERLVGRTVSHTTWPGVVREVRRSDVVVETIDDTTGKLALHLVTLRPEQARPKVGATFGVPVAILAQLEPTRCPRTARATWRSIGWRSRCA